MEKIYVTQIQHSNYLKAFSFEYEKAAHIDYHPIPFHFQLLVDICLLEIFV